MIPLGDENPTLHTPWMTLFILGGMFAVWILVQGAGLDERTLVTSVCNLGMVPGELTHLAPLGFSIPITRDLSCAIDNDAINYLTPLISMFLHGSWMHILGNALFFWVFANDVEDVMGPGRFLVFYLVCGLAAAATQIAIDPSSPIPTVGASGAISGVMGAFLLLYPRVRVRMLFVVFIVPIPAWMVLIWWFALQLLSGLPQVFSPSPDIAGGGGVAVWAHVGGFVAGMLLGRFFLRPELLAQRRVAFGRAPVPGL
jgi:membrane associated rhomboid family serine protease